MNLSSNLENSAFFFPKRPAVCENDLMTAYWQLSEKSNTIATVLIKMGVRHGDFIGFLAANSMDWIALYFGVLKTGAVAITFSSLLRGNELSLLVGHSKPKMVFTYDPKKERGIQKKQKNLFWS